MTAIEITFVSVTVLFISYLLVSKILMEGRNQRASEEREKKYIEMIKKYQNMAVSKDFSTYRALEEVEQKPPPKPPEQPIMPIHPEAVDYSDMVISPKGFE